MKKTAIDLTFIFPRKFVCKHKNFGVLVGEYKKVKNGNVIYGHIMWYF